jgi:hypothetical protein
LEREAIKKGKILEGSVLSLAPECSSPTSPKLSMLRKGYKRSEEKDYTSDKIIVIISPFPWPASYEKL